jgi:hypothetical protein
MARSSMWGSGNVWSSFLGQFCRQDHGDNLFGHSGGSWHRGRFLGAQRARLVRRWSFRSYANNPSVCRCHTGTCMPILDRFPIYPFTQIQGVI